MNQALNGKRLYQHYSKMYPTEHSITQIKPNEAGKNHLWVNWHLQNTSKKKRKHSDVKDGDMFKDFN